LCSTLFLTKNYSLFLEQGLSAIFQEFDFNKSLFMISLSISQKFEFLYYFISPPQIRERIG